jgi:two-component system, chemotaxis family, protein-glutamate methylesterase/glutaminase
MRKTRAIVMGGSAGALEALGALLPALPADFPTPIALVVHVPPMKRSYLAEVLASRCALAVREVDDKEPLSARTIHVAPPDYHLLIEKSGQLSLSDDEPVHFSRPSIDVLFESAADAFGAETTAVLLSGANDDGARGFARVGERGGLLLVQSPASSVEPTMPSAAMRLARPHHVSSPAELGALLATEAR